MATLTPRDGPSPDLPESLKRWLEARAQKGAQSVSPGDLKSGIDITPQQRAEFLEKILPVTEAPEPPQEPERDRSMLASPQASLPKDFFHRPGR